jgi:diacylglycerol kinase (ATP)
MRSVSRVGILFNPVSGTGRGSSFASSISVYLLSRGLEVRSRESSRKYQEDDLKSFFEEVDAMVIVGGDGTIRPLLPLLASTGVPVVLFPAGNESLIAKKFQVSTLIPDLYERLERGRCEDHYFAYMNDLPFFLMAGIGLDSEVVRYFDRMRNRGSSDFLYLLAFVRATCLWKVPEFTLESPVCRYLPDRLIISSCIVANSSMYARRFLPSAEASSQSPELLIRFPGGGKFQTILNWMYSAISGRGISLENSRHFFSEKCSIKMSDFVAVQLDGDYAGQFNAAEFRKSERWIRFLV